jgi:hypothetical protein
VYNVRISVSRSWFLNITQRPVYHVCRVHDRHCVCLVFGQLFYNVELDVEVV